MIKDDSGHGERYDLTIVRNGNKRLKRKSDSRKKRRNKFQLLHIVRRCPSLQPPYFHPDFIADSGVGGTASLETKTNIPPRKAKKERITEKCKQKQKQKECENKQKPSKQTLALVGQLDGWLVGYGNSQQTYRPLHIQYTSRFIHCW